MNKLETSIRQDITTCTKQKRRDVANILKMVLGEIPRLNMKAGEFATDDQVTKIIIKLIKSETDTINLAYTEESDRDKHMTESQYITVLSVYLPKPINEEDIIKWIGDNVDFSTLRNKMQAVGHVTKHFGNAVNGKVVSQIIQKNF